MEIIIQDIQKIYDHDLSSTRQVRFNQQKAGDRWNSFTLKVAWIKKMPLGEKNIWKPIMEKCSWKRGSNRIPQGKLAEI